MSKKKFLAIYAKSFNWAGAFLPKEIYEDCSSLYNFCRSVDDIADCDDKLSVKVQKMNTFIDSFNSKNCDDEIILDMKRLIIKYNISDKIIF
ncbi:MAG: squalene/phytoene synthase family protein, partial [Pseudomonadota bacterium]|nr:squalene/phytoene synthase family protein [Pseudomonadota bacterium]